MINGKRIPPSSRELSFGFVSTRFAGTDGVSLETQKWAEVLRERGSKTFFMAGQLDTAPAVSHLSPKSFFHHPDVLEINEALFTRKERTRAVSAAVQETKDEIRKDLEEFRRRFQFDVLIVQNSLSLPVNIPLGLALVEFIMEHDIPTIAHHHDFYWERRRFCSAAASDYLRVAFPPDYPRIQHVVINSIAGRQLSHRIGVNWTLIPNVLDFKTMPPGIDEYTADFREEIGVAEDALLVLQPTRIVPRKGIERAIEIVRQLGYAKAHLVIPHEAGDEGLAYQERVEEYARFMGVDLRLIADRIADERGTDENGRKLFTLWDVYPHADLVTYPSTYEGYGNAFVEAVYFRKPIVVNRYMIFEADIEPKDFDVITFSDFITPDVIKRTREVLEDRELAARMVEHNYMQGWHYLSHEMLAEQLDILLTNIYGA